jgi:lipoprotein-releasing system ATP-binding protein
MDSAPLVSVQQVSRTFGSGENATTVLKSVDLEVQAGEFAAILGPSGSGKSTLLNLIGALDKPSSGEVWIDGVPLSEQNDAGLAHVRGTKLGFIFQFHYLLPDFTALENVLMPARIATDQVASDRRAEAEALLEAVGVGHRKHYRATDLSGGQQQRVAIARALAGRKKLVMADEPTGNLDSKTGQEAWDLMRRFCVEQQVTFLIVTHDLRLAEATDRIIEIRDGEIVRDERK